MGIRGFAAFLSKRLPNSGTSQYSQEGDTQQFIVDGNSFVHLVSRNINWVCGSQYRLLEEQIIRYYTLMSTTGKPVFVFDGALPQYKISERLDRIQSRFDMIESIVASAINGSWTQDVMFKASTVLPAFAVQVGFSVLSHLGATVTIADGEADEWIAKEARRLRANVWSQDSDFFFHNIPGYVPFDSCSFQFDNNAISYRLYERDKLCLSLGISLEQIPLLAVLGGSDHFTYNEWERISRDNSKFDVPMHGRHRWPKLMKLFSELKTKTLDECMELLCQQFTILADRDQIKHAFETALVQYHATQETQDHREIKWHRKLLEIEQSNTFWGRPMLEDLQQPSCWQISLAVREMIYGLVAPGQPITEYTRAEKKISKHIVQPPPIEKQADGEGLFWDLVGYKPNNVPDQLSIYILAVRQILMHSEHNLGNHELAALVFSIMLSDAKFTPPKQTPTLRSLHLAAQLECTVMCLFLLSQVLYPGLCTHGFWRCLPNDGIHWAFQLLRRGQMPSKILSKAKLDSQLYQHIHANVTHGLEDQIETIFSYE
ncbi:PIN domain-like protein [Gorgonomyces haynaldii]|nr:PIN domain-like protein [Gorgonomyces haynaldii]